LYDNRPDEAIAEWEIAAGTKPQLPMVMRNLAFGSFYHQKDADKAIEYLTGAIHESPDNPLWYDELLTYYEASGRDPGECLAILEAHEEIVLKNVSAPKGLVSLLNLNGEYDRAIDLLDTHHFRTWEGGRSIYWYYVDAHVLKAMELMNQDSCPEAIAHLERAMEYPENLEVGKPLNDERNALVYYVMGEVYEIMGKKKDAMRSYKKCVECTNSWAWPDLMYYQGLARLITGDESGAEEMFDQLEKKGKALLEENGIGTGTGVDESNSLANKESISEGYYLQGLARLGKGDPERAGEMFGKAVKTYRNNLWAGYFFHTFTP
jgi:tetratricopeptide (TPR) repeat protein